MTAKGKQSGPKEEKPASFEDALSRLELIVQDLESKELSLEETLARYEEGSKLVAECRRRLDAAEQRIRTIGGEPDQTESTGGTDENEAAGDIPF
jgi:exodeoxyribonuclease VII small subunit